MNALIEWLREQLDADERSIEIWGRADVYIDTGDEIGDFLDRFDEDRMLAEVKAKRDIVDRLVRNARDVARATIECPGNVDCACTPCLEIRDLAQPYANRAGWRDEWSVG